MGFRVSLYCVPKEIVNKWKDITEKEYEDCSDKVFDELEKECMIYDVLTDVLLHNKNDNFCSRLFTNKLDIECDMSFYTISKEQLLNIIEEVRVNHICKWFGDRVINNNELGKAFKDMPPEIKFTTEDALKANQGEWNFKAHCWKHKWKNTEHNDYGYYHINLHMDNKWQISGGSTYEYLIFDLIHILKIFDWDNNVIVAIGG